MEPGQTPEADLQAWIVAAQQGDETAFENLYGHFFTQVYRYAAFRLPRELAEDVTAEVFIKAWEKLHTYKARSGVRKHQVNAGVCKLQHSSEWP